MTLAERTLEELQTPKGGPLFCAMTTLSGLSGVASVRAAMTTPARPTRRAGLRARPLGRGGLFVAVLVGLVVSIAIDSSQALAHSGIAFLWSGTWNPAANQFGAGILVVGTIVTTAVAMVIVIPIGLGMAAFLSELAPRWLAGPLATAIDLLAAVPSIVVGLWALLVLSPLFANHVEPFFKSVPALEWFFHGPAYGPSILLASVVLAVMTLPTVVALTRTALSGVALADREGAMALGATHWQVVREVVFPGGSFRHRGGALTLAVGRALGESIAVAMVIGNNPSVPHSLVAPGATLGSAIVNEFAEAAPGIGTSSVIALAAVLLLLTLLVNAGGQAMLRGMGPGRLHREARPPRAPRREVVGMSSDAGVIQLADAGADWSAREKRRPVIQAAARRTLRRRRAAGKAVQTLCVLSAAIALAPLVALVYYTAERGLSGLSFGFLIHAPVPEVFPEAGSRRRSRARARSSASPS